ncbi:Metallo-hydrolase/oxidoreductase, partial [Atractiella rhizophila]
GFLVQIPTPTHTVHVLIDPIFSSRSSPSQWFGPRRIIDSPCKVEELPGVDYVLISHNHYDHLDLESIQGTILHFPDAKYLVPLGLRQWMIETGVKEENVFELDWWEDIEFEDVRLVCVPAQHNKGRSVGDQGSTLWCGWVVETTKNEERLAIYHAGDTGYRSADDTCPAFKEIGEKYGPLTASMIPIWRGGSLSFLSTMGVRLRTHKLTANIHGDPTDAIDIHIDVRSKNSIGMHFGTFVGTHEEGTEAIISLSKILEKRGVKELKRGDKEEDGMGIMDIGETRWFSP